MDARTKLQLRQVGYAGSKTKKTYPPVMIAMVAAGVAIVAIGWGQTKIW